MKKFVLLIIILITLNGCSGGSSSKSTDNNSKYISIVPLEDMNQERNIQYKVEIEVPESTPYDNTVIADKYIEAIKVTITYTDEIDDNQVLYVDGYLNSEANHVLGLDPYEKLRSLRVYLPANQKYLMTLRQYKDDPNEPVTFVKFILDAPAFYKIYKGRSLVKIYKGRSLVENFC